MTSTTLTTYVGSGLQNITGTNLSGSTINWSQPDYTSCVISVNPEEPTLEVKGTIKMKNGDILDERLERIETLLEIPTRDLALEREFPKLRELWNAYTEELEKYKNWKKIKESK